MYAVAPQSIGSAVLDSAAAVFEAEVPFSSSSLTFPPSHARSTLAVYSTLDYTLQDQLLLIGLHLYYAFGSLSNGV